MTRWGFHASHEQISPRQLLADVQQAEQAGLDMAMCSDHISPWSERQGHSGYTWSWLGAALATTSLRFGCVTAPGQRYPVPELIGPAVSVESAGRVAAWADGLVTNRVQPDEVREAVNVSADLAQHRDRLAEYTELGFDEIYLHHVGQEQKGFIDAFGSTVLPELRAA